MALILSACGGNSSDTLPQAPPLSVSNNTPSARPLSLTGAVVANEVAIASLSVYRVVNGVQAALPMATGSTTSDGSYQMRLPDCTDPCTFVVHASGGQFTNEFTGQTETILAASPVRAAADVDAAAEEAEVVLTPFTEAAVQDASSDGDLDASDITASNATVAKLILGATGADSEASTTLLSTVPEVTTVAPAPDNAELDDQKRLYGLMLAGAAAMGDLSDTAESIALDIADGMLDEQADRLSEAVQSVLASDMNQTGLTTATAVTNQLAAARQGQVRAEATERDIVAVYTDPEALTTLVNTLNKTVHVRLPAGTDVTSLAPQFVLSVGASITPTGAQDFSQPVPYTVTAENNESQVWTVSMAAQADGAASPLAQVLQMSHPAIETLLINEGRGVITGEVRGGGLAELDSVSELSELFSLSPGAGIALASGSYATGEVQYAVTAADSTVRDWLVRLVEQGLAEQPAMSFVGGAYQTTKVNTAIGDRSTVSLSANGGHDAITTKFSSSDENVATVDASSGVVTLLSEGTVVITATKPSAQVEDKTFAVATVQTILSVSLKAQDTINAGSDASKT